jgi:hypothetical protein
MQYLIRNVHATPVARRVTSSRTWRPQARLLPSPDTYLPRRLRRTRRQSVHLQLEGFKTLGEIRLRTPFWRVERHRMLTYSIQRHAPLNLSGDDVLPSSESEAGSQPIAVSGAVTAAIFPQQHRRRGHSMTPLIHESEAKIQREMFRKSSVDGTRTLAHSALTQ